MAEIGSTFPLDTVPYFGELSIVLKRSLQKAITQAMAGNDAEATALIALLAAADAELDTAVA